MAVPIHQKEDITRDADLFFPIFLLMNSYLLPILLNLIAAYLKDIMDGSSKKEGNIELDIILSEDENKKERWYKIKGDISDVLKALDKLNM